MSALHARLCLLTSTALIVLAPLAAHAQDRRANISADDIEAAQYDGGDLPSGQSALTAKVQILLDRTGVSPGVVDGFKGGMSESAILAFERGHGLPMDGRMDPDIWAFLQAYAGAPLTMDYIITEDDAQGLVDAIPHDYAEKAAMTSQGYTSVVEKLGERFHMDDKFLTQLNPGIDFMPGATITVTVPAKPLKAKVARILIDKAAHRVAAYDANGKMVVDYPATIGSAATPSPHGTHTVRAVALNPTYTYNPQKNFKQGNNDKVLTIPPGPNGPVGNVWIDLSQPTYGIHGTSTPSRLFVQESHGCVRLTNWDAQELAHMVQTGTTVVEFLPPGTSIADATGPDATLAHAKPRVEPAPEAAANVPGVDATAIDATVMKAIDGADAAGASATGADPAGAAQGGLLAAGRPGVNPFRNVVTTATAVLTPDETVAPNDTTLLPGVPPASTGAVYGLAPMDQAVPTEAAPTIHESTDEEEADAALPQLPETVPGQQPGQVVVFPATPAGN